MHRRFGIAAASIVIAALLVGAGAAASQGSPGSGSASASANRQYGVWRSVPASTDSRAFRAVPNLQAEVCAIGEVSVTVSMSGGSGAPMLLRVQQDDGPILAPGAVTFELGLAGFTSFTFLAPVADGDHTFQLEWRSPEGGRTTLLAATMNLVYQQGSACS